MSARMKAHLTSVQKNISVVVTIPGNQEVFYSIPNTKEGKETLEKLCKILHVEDSSRGKTQWKEATSWDEVAAERIKRYKKAGLVLRGARYRQGLSQKQLASRCGISQDNLSRMENGKRVIGEKTAKKLAKVLRIDYQLLLIQ